MKKYFSKVIFLSVYFLAIILVGLVVSNVAHVSKSLAQTTDPTPTIKLAKSLGNTQPASGSYISSPSNQIYLYAGNPNTLWIEVTGGKPNSPVSLSYNAGGSEGPGTPGWTMLNIKNTDASGYAILGPWQSASGIPADWPAKLGYTGWVKVGNSAWSAAQKYEIRASSAAAPSCAIVPNVSTVTPSAGFRLTWSSANAVSVVSHWDNNASYIPVHTTSASGPFISDGSLPANSSWNPIYKAAGERPSRVVITVTNSAGVISACSATITNQTSGTDPTPTIKLAKSPGNTQPASGSFISSPSNQLFVNAGNPNTLWIEVVGGKPNSPVSLSFNAGGSEGPGTPGWTIENIKNTNASGYAVIGPYQSASGFSADSPAKLNYTGWVKVGNSAWSAAQKYEVKAGAIISPLPIPSPVLKIAKSSGSTPPALNSYIPSPSNQIYFNRGTADTIWLQITGASDSIVYLKYTDGVTAYGPYNYGRTTAAGTLVIGPFPGFSGVPASWPARQNYEAWVQIGSNWSNDVKYEIKSLTGGVTPTPSPQPGGTLAIGNRVRVNSKGGLNILSSPDSAGTKVGGAALNAEGIIQDGPRSYLSYTWWKIAYSFGTFGISTGWSAERDSGSGTIYLQKVDGSAAVPTCSITPGNSMVAPNTAFGLSWASINAVSAVSHWGNTAVNLPPHTGSASGPLKGDETLATSGSWNNLYKSAGERPSRVSITVTNSSGAVNLCYATVQLSAGAVTPSPIPSLAPTPSQPPGGTLAIGDRVRVNSTAGLNIRSSPDSVGTKVGGAAMNAEGIIQDGPRSYIGYTWWKIAYSFGTIGQSTGWSAEGNASVKYLVLAGVGGTDPTPTIKLAKSPGNTQPASGSFISSPSNQLFVNAGNPNTLWIEVVGGKPNSPVSLSFNAGGTEGPGTPGWTIENIKNTNASGYAVIGPYQSASGFSADSPAKLNYTGWVKVGNSAWSAAQKYEVKASIGGATPTPSPQPGGNNITIISDTDVVVRDSLGRIIGTQSINYGVTTNAQCTPLNGKLYTYVDFTDSTLDGCVEQSYLRPYTQADLQTVISASTNTCNNNIKGDLDCNGVVTVTDGVVALRCASGLSPCETMPIDPDIIKQADLNCDGLITSTDGVNVLRLAADLNVPACGTNSSTGKIHGIVWDSGGPNGVGVTLTLNSTGARQVPALPYYAYTFENVSLGTQTISITLPPGYSGAKYHNCMTARACVDKPWISGTSVTIDFPHEYQEPTKAGNVYLDWLLIPITDFPSPTPPPTTFDGGWTFCANHGQTCSFAGTKEVRYGANGVYTDRAKTGLRAFTNSVMCDTTVFDDPLFGTLKQCQYRTGKLQLNARVVAISKDALGVYSTPSGSLAGYQSLIAQGTVIGGPTLVAGSQWLNVNFDTGVDGWVSELNLYYIDQVQLANGIAAVHGGIPPLKGDVDDKGGDHQFSGPREDMTVVDGVLALQCSRGQAPCAPGAVDQNKFYASDVDCSGSVTGDDATAIFNFAAKLPVATKIYACMATSQKEVAGGYLKRNNGECSAPNVMTGACSCEWGYHPSNFGSIRGTDKAFLATDYKPNGGGMSFTEKSISTAVAVFQFPTLPAYLGPFADVGNVIPSWGSLLGEVFKPLGSEIIGDVAHFFGSEAPSAISTTVTIDVAGYSVNISYIGLAITVAKLLYQGYTMLTPDIYKPGSPGNTYMCIKDVYSSSYGYQGGFSSMGSVETGTQKNEFTNDYTCPLGTVRDRVAKGLRSKIGSNLDDSMEDLFVCRNHNAPLSGINRSAYGGMYQTNVSGDKCVKGNVIGDKTETEAWRYSSAGSVQLVSLLDTPNGVGTYTGEVGDSCSCRKGYGSMPVASITDWDLEPGILWLCTIPGVVEIKTPATTLDKGAVRVRVLDATKENNGMIDGIGTYVSLGSMEYRANILRTTRENRYTVGWSDLPIPWTHEYLYTGGQTIQVGIPKGYTKASISVCRNNSVDCPSTATEVKPMRILTGHDLTEQGRLVAISEFLLHPGDWVDAYIFLMH